MGCWCAMMLMLFENTVARSQDWDHILELKAEMSSEGFPCWAGSMCRLATSECDQLAETKTWVAYNYPETRVMRSWWWRALVIGPEAFASTSGTVLFSWG